jgi:calcium-dependent protein kinase
MGCGSSQNSNSKRFLGPVLKGSKRLNLTKHGSLTDYTTLHYLGRGSFAEVVVSRYLPANTLRALKIVKKDRVTFEHLDNKGGLKEASILRQLKHNNIVTAFEPYEDSQFFYLPLELCDGGTLWSRIMTIGKFNLHDAATIMSQIFSALVVIHEKNFVHRDIKPENVLFTRNTGLEVKLADFGCTCEKDEEGLIHSMFGTLYYVAPEIFKEPYNEKFDMWSCGVLLYVLLSGRLPYDGISEKNLKERIMMEPFRVTEEMIPVKNEKLMDLFGKLLDVNPRQRISAKEALKHGWVEEFAERLSFYEDDRNSYTNTECGREICREINGDNRENVLKMRKVGFGEFGSDKGCKYTEQENL